MNFLIKIIQEKKGAAMPEYAIIAGVVVLVCILAFTNLGNVIIRNILNLVAGYP